MCTCGYVVATTVSDHFHSDNHSPNDIELIPLELIQSSRDELRKAREAYLIERGQTLEPKSSIVVGGTSTVFSIGFCVGNFVLVILR